MARIRTIKPEILEDEKTAALSSGAWRLFVSVIVLADNHGRLRANPQWLFGQVFWSAPGESLTKLKSYLEELTNVGLVSTYVVSGQPYMTITNWAKHQRIDTAGAPRCPGPEEATQNQGDASCGELPQVAASCGGLPLDLRTEGPKDRRTEGGEATRSDRIRDLAPASPTSPTVFEIPTTTGVYHVTEDDLAKWQDLAPAVDIKASMRDVLLWLDGKPSRRKTAGGVRRFLTSWIQRDQDSGKNRRSGDRSSSPPPNGYRRNGYTDTPYNGPTMEDTERILAERAKRDAAIDLEKQREREAENASAA